MRHLDDGSLRRIIDEPFAVSAVRRAHLETCPACSARFAQVQSDMNQTRGWLAVPLPESDVGAALKRQAVPAASRPYRAETFGWGLRMNRAPAWAFGAALVVMVAGTVAFTPVRNVLTIFQPANVTSISVTTGELRTLPNLRHFGRLSIPRNGKSEQFSSIGQAQTAASFHVSRPSSLPSGVSGSATYQVVPFETSSFTFSARKAAQTAKRLHERLPLMPATLNGSTISLHTSPAVLTIYGGNSEIPSLIIGQTPRPAVTSTGANLSQIERYVLHLPGVSPQLAQQIESIGNPTTTLPIPVPVNWAFAQHVTVQGHPALLVGDNTGVASVIVWQANGVVYGVAGALTQGQVLQVANSLH